MYYVDIESVDETFTFSDGVAPQEMCIEDITVVIDNVFEGIDSLIDMVFYLTTTFNGDTNIHHRFQQYVRTYAAATLNSSLTSYLPRSSLSLPPPFPMSPPIHTSPSYTPPSPLPPPFLDSPSLPPLLTLSPFLDPPLPY